MNIERHTCAVERSARDNLCSSVMMLGGSRRACKDTVDTRHADMTRVHEDYHQALTIEDIEHEQASLQDMMDSCIAGCSQAMYRQKARSLTAIKPHWPTRAEWAKSEKLATGCALLNCVQTVIMAQVDRLHRLCNETNPPGHEWEEELRQHNVVGFLPKREFKAGALHRRYEM